MKKKIFLFFLAAVLSIAATGCGEADKPQSETTPKSSVTTSKATETSSTSEAIEYNGTFNEEVFNQVCRDIVIEGNKIVFPCSLNDMGNEFTFGEYPVTNESSKLQSNALLYNDKKVGSCTIRYLDENDTYYDCIMTGLSFYKSDIAKQENPISISFGEINFESSEYDVKKSFGEPTKTTEFSNGEKRLDYSSSENCMICFRINEDKEIISIEIYNEE